MRKRIKARGLNHVPEEILEEILINLPVKSLLRFKCVSKPWRCLLSSNDFVKAHLKKPSHFTNHKLIYSSYESYDFNRYRTDYRLASYSLKSLLDQPISTNEEKKDDYSTIITSSDYRYPTGINPVSIGFVGSCNGLVLITINLTSLLVWNPSTRQVKNIPWPSFNSPGTVLRVVSALGFGYDHSTDDYKVVFIKNAFPRSPCQTKIYSLRNNSWKDIENFNTTGSIWGRNPKLLNGKLHWSGNIAGDWKIVSLDLVGEEEKFDLLGLPKGSSIYNRNWQRFVDVLGGYFCFISVTEVMDVNLWIMKKYGEVESWAMIWTFSDFGDPRRHSCCPLPMWLTENGDIAVRFGTSVVVVYNVEDKLSKSRVYAVDAKLQQHGLIYVESLVSPELNS